MSNLKPLIDALAFVKANPDKHNQSNCYAEYDARCIVSYTFSNMGRELRFNEYDFCDAANDLGVSYSELNALFLAGRASSITQAEGLIAKYSPAPVEQELKISFIVTGESHFGRWFEYTAIDEEDGKATARVLSKGLAPGYNINLTKVYTTPSPESVDF